MSTQLFAVNKTNTHLLLKNGYVRIEQGGYRPVREADLEHPDFQEAKERGFIEVTDKEPKVKAQVAGIKPIEYVEPYRGLTAEELKAVQAKEQPKPAATTEAIGKPAPVAEAEAKEETAPKAKKASAKSE
jgi:hypothetical protein